MGEILDQEAQNLAISGKKKKEFYSGDKMNKPEAVKKIPKKRGPRKKASIDEVKAKMNALIDQLVEAVKNGARVSW